MKHWGAVVVLTLLSLSTVPVAIGEAKYSQLSIDCGATVQIVDGLTGITWQLDDGFVKGGENKDLPTNTSDNLFWMNNLRYFPKGKKSCYTLPLNSKKKYLLRAGFLYRNYDNLNSPPTFDLEFDGNPWATVDTSLTSEPIFHELIYIPKTHKVKICLIRRKKQGIPFVSSLEAFYIDESVGPVYRFMNDKFALYLRSRVSYGANVTSLERFSLKEEVFNRYWMPQVVPNCRNIAWNEAVNSNASAMVENFPPYNVLAHAIEAQNVAASIFLPITFDQNQKKKKKLKAYFVLYFTELDSLRPPNSTRKLTVHINEQVKEVIVGPRQLQQVAVLSIYPVEVKEAKAYVTLAPAIDTTLAPILNALEVFLAIEDLDDSEWAQRYFWFLLLLIAFFALFAREA